MTLTGPRRPEAAVCPQGECTRTGQRGAPATSGDWRERRSCARRTRVKNKAMVGRMSTCDREELREVSAAVLAVTAHLSVREVLQTIVTAARRLVDAQYAALGIPGENSSFSEFLADGLTGAQWRAIGPVPRQHGILGL